MRGVESKLVGVALLRPLLPAVWRTVPWRVLAAAGAAGLLLAGSTRIPDGEPGAGIGLFVLRVTALVGAFGLVFVLDDPARNTSTGTPVGRAVRTVLRLAFVAPLAALWWTAVLLLLPAATRPPTAPVTLQAAGTAVAALALATVAVRFTDRAEVGRTTATRLTAVALLVTVVPDRWGLLAGPDGLWWQAVQIRWAVVLCAALAACALWTPEPLVRRRPIPARTGRPIPTRTG
ncbi:ABC transporter [Streptomyces antibioticus]|uniref:ABC transporter n=1 Tax=Streptomyces antibioticus TaxID=1890 RepID=UPI0033AFC0A7